MLKMLWLKPYDVYSFFKYYLVIIMVKLVLKKQFYNRKKGILRLILCKKIRKYYVGVKKKEIKHCLLTVT